MSADLHPELAWQAKARCRRSDADLDLWSEKERAPEAIHQCLRHCPVVAECWAWAQPQQWDSVTVAGQWWASTTSSRPCRPVDGVIEQRCDGCQPIEGCSECGRPIVGRRAQARTCSPACGRQRRLVRGRVYNRTHDARRKAARKAARAAARRCEVCQVGLPDGTPARRRTCGSGECVSQWEARLSRASSRAHHARRSGQELAA